MIGAIIGDIAGSIYEFNNIKTEDFPLIGEGCFFTDDTVMTIAVAEALQNGGRDEKKTETCLVKSMKKFGKLYPNAGYGGRFSAWLQNPEPKPYNSFGNGSAMRVSPVAWYFHCLEKVEKFAEISALVTHDHPEGIRGAQAVAAAIFMARNGRSKDYIKRYIELKYRYEFSKTLNEIRPNYHFDETCQGTVPVALEVFFEAKDFEDTLRKAISMGGDSDTLAAIACSIAEAFYPIPDEIKKKALPLLDKKLTSMLKKWDSDISVSSSPFEHRDLLLYTDYLLSNPHTEKKNIRHPSMEKEIVVPEYGEKMYNFIHDAVLSPFFREDYKEILARHGINHYEDMIVELPYAGENLLSAMLTLIISGEKINPGNIAWAAETGILGDILQGLKECKE